MTEKEEIVKQLQENYEADFFKEHGFIMNSRQKKMLRKQIEKMVDRKLKNK